MSRNDGRKDTSASAFRKIDVDQYSDNNFKEEDADGGLGAPTGPDENEILTLLSQYPFIRNARVSLAFFSQTALFLNRLFKGKNAEALISVLKSAPLDCKNQQIKVTSKRIPLIRFLFSPHRRRRRHSLALHSASEILGRC